MSKLSKSEFVEGYCERSNMTKEEYDLRLIALPCACEAEICQGWATVFNDPQIIEAHMETYAPEKEDYE